MPAKKKTDTELIKEAKLKQKVLEARLVQGLTFDAIAQKFKLNDRTAAKRLFDATLLELIEYQTHQDFEHWRSGEIFFWENLISEAIAGWKASKGKKKESTSVSKTVFIKDGEGEDAVKIPALEVKTTVKTWHDAGDARMLQVAKEGKSELYALLGVKSLQAAAADSKNKTGGQTELVIHQNVYIPGFADITHEEMEQFWHDLEANFDDSAP